MKVLYEPNGGHSCRRELPDPKTTDLLTGTIVQCDCGNFLELEHYRKINLRDWWIIGEKRLRKLRKKGRLPVSVPHNSAGTEG